MWYTVSMAFPEKDTQSPQQPISEAEQRNDAERWYEERISQLSNVTVDRGELFDLLLWDGAQLDDWTRPLFYKYVGYARNNRERNEKWHDFSCLASGFFNMSTFTNSYGVYAPEYTDQLQRFKCTRRQQQPHRALLVGASGTLTVQEFATTVRQVFPDAELTVADIQGETTRQAAEAVGEFRTHDILDDPLSLGQFDTIHTNFLLQDIPSGSHWQKTAPAVHSLVFPNLHAALKPHGMILLVETFDTIQDTTHAVETAGGTGFQQVTCELARRFSRRRSVERFVHRDFPDSSVENIDTYPSVFVITGQK